MKRIRPALLCALLVTLLVTTSSAAEKKKKDNSNSPLDGYIRDATKRDPALATEPSGSIWSSSAGFADLGRDLRSSQVDDMVTIVVAENASAVSTGSTKTSRASSVNGSITALAGPQKATGTLSNLVAANGAKSLNGQGTTSRTTTLTATLTARVTRVLPNGYMVVEGSKLVQVNGEKQIVTVRGVIRPTDLGTDNSIQSNRLAQMEVKIDGKGVVNDAIHRPFFLYRLLLDLLPF